PEKYVAFSRDFYKQSFELGSTGMLVQQLPLIRSGGGQPFTISWLSQSGSGNRDTKVRGVRNELPNWCDAKSPASAETPYAELYRDLFNQHMGMELKAANKSTNGVFLTGLPPMTLAILYPEQSRVAQPYGLLTAMDGSAWPIISPPGAWHLVYGDKSKK